MRSSSPVILLKICLSLQKIAIPTVVSQYQYKCIATLRIESQIFFSLLHTYEIGQLIGNLVSVTALAYC